MTRDISILLHSNKLEVPELGKETQGLFLVSNNLEQTFELSEFTYKYARHFSEE